MNYRYYLTIFKRLVNIMRYLYCDGEIMREGVNNNMIGILKKCESFMFGSDKKVCIFTNDCLEKKFVISLIF